MTMDSDFLVSSWSVSFWTVVAKATCAPTSASAAIAMIRKSLNRFIACSPDVRICFGGPDGSRDTCDEAGLRQKRGVGFSPAITSPRTQWILLLKRHEVWKRSGGRGSAGSLPWDSRAVCPRSGRNYIKCLELCQRRATQLSSPGGTFWTEMSLTDSQSGHDCRLRCVDFSPCTARISRLWARVSGAM